MRFFKLAAAAAALVFSSLIITACGGDAAAVDTSTPEGTATAFMQKAFDGDVPGMVGLLNMGPEEQQYKEQIEGKLDLMAKDVQSKAQKHGGVDKLEAVGSEEWKNGAIRVRVKSTFKDGTDRTERVIVEKVGDVWKVKL